MFSVGSSKGCGLHLLSYQYVASCTAFRAGTQKNVKEGAMCFFFFFFQSKLANFQYLSQPCSPHCLAVSGSCKDSEFREGAVTRHLPSWVFLSPFIGYHSSLVEPSIWISTRSQICRESYSSTEFPKLSTNSAH